MMTKRYRIKVRNIVMGVPINFLSKYSPEQFEIVGGAMDCENTFCHIQKDYAKLGYKFFKQDGGVSGSGALRDKMTPKIPVKGNGDYSLAPDGSVLSAVYSRIFIRKKHKKTKRFRIKVRNIVMGVPITFLDKYCPKQFEIVSFRKGDNGEDLIFSKKKRTSLTVLSSLCTTSIAGVIKSKEGLINGKLTYARITIRKVV